MRPLSRSDLRAPELIGIANRGPTPGSRPRWVVGIWALSGGGYFWPAWVMAAWGVGIVFQVWDYLRPPITEVDVDAEVRRMQSPGR